MNLNDVIPLVDLPSANPSESDYLISSRRSDGKALKVVMPEVTAAARVVGEAIDGVVGQVNDSANAAISGVQAQANTAVFNTQTQAAVVLASLGYMVPVPYAAGLNVADGRFTVTYGGSSYAPVATAVPFTTGATFDAAKWRLVQGVTSSDLLAAAGSSMVGLLQGGTIQQAIRYVTPFMFLGVGNGAVDDTAAVRAAAAYAALYSVPIDLRGGEWRVSGTIDFTSVPTVISDKKSIIRVNPVGFVSTKADPWVVIFGDPDTDRNANRASSTTVTGLLQVISDSRAQALNGIFFKGALLAVDAIRAYGFNGRGVELAATWDSTFKSIATELCGNTNQYGLNIYGMGDTSNCLNIGRIQCERAYQRCASIICIRSVINTIHAERTAVISNNDGTTGLATGLTYVTFNIDVGNTTINQMVHDVITTGAAPDGTALAAVVSSVSINLDYSSLRDAQVVGGSISTTRGRCSEYAQVTAANWTWGGSSSTAFGNTVLNPNITGIFRPLAKLSIVGGVAAALQPAFNAQDLCVRGMDITALTFPSNIVGNLLFDSCRFPASMTLGDTKSPTGFASATGSIGETHAPVTFRDCEVLGTVTGSFNARAIFQGGYIQTVAMVSQAQIEFYGVKGQVFGHAGNAAYITRQCKFQTINQWSVPSQGRYPVGTLTERMGAGAGRLFFSAANDAATWTQAA